jgi:predicted MFS family arabinose efflux permease
MVRRGRRVGLATGYGIGLAGAFVATTAVVVGSMAMLLVGTVLIGFGNASNQLSRYVAADQSSRHDHPGLDRSTPASLAAVLGRPNVPVAIVALVTVQVVMTLVMTMTPLHMTDHGSNLAAVGIVISGHTLGMFALSPISGRLTDRIGMIPVILAGLGVTATASGLAALAPSDGGILLFIALFLLGYGWNLGYVAGSALLTHGLSLAERTRVQGLTDGLIWSSAAAASLGSGVVVAAASYATLGLLGAAIVVVPALVVIARRSSVAGQPTA